MCIGLALLLLTGCDVNEMSSLSEISKPYTGEYTCRMLALDGRDLLSDFDYIRLDLDGRGDFTLSYRNKYGAQGEYGGTYTVQENNILFTAANGRRSETRSFPYENGVIRMELPLGRRLLLCEFSCK